MVEWRDCDMCIVKRNAAQRYKVQRYDVIVSAIGQASRFFSLLGHINFAIVLGGDF